MSGQWLVSAMHGNNVSCDKCAATDIALNKKKNTSAVHQQISKDMETDMVRDTRLLTRKAVLPVIEQLSFITANGIVILQTCKQINHRQWMQRQSEVRHCVGGSLPASREHQSLGTLLRMIAECIRALKHFIGNHIYTTRPPLTFIK
jgi:hypothetical protein